MCNRYIYILCSASLTFHHLPLMYHLLRLMHHHLQFKFHLSQLCPQCLTLQNSQCQMYFLSNRSLLDHLRFREDVLVVYPILLFLCLCLQLIQQYFCWPCLDRPDVPQQRGVVQVTSASFSSNPRQSALHKIHILQCDKLYSNNATFHEFNDILILFWLLKFQ